MLDIFYNEIINEAATGRIDCFGIYNVIFSTSVKEDNVLIKSSNDNKNLIIPTLTINDKELFNKLLIEYTLKAQSFYNSDDFFEEIRNDDKMIKKTIMTLLWSNATYDDFIDPISYLRKRIDFFEPVLDDRDLGYCEKLNSNISVKIIKNKIFHETPNGMKITLSDGNNYYQLPIIYYGISSNEAYVYAIQKEKKPNEVNEKYYKKINRLLYSIDNGLDVKNETFENYDIGNLKDVSSSFVLAANIFSGLIKNSSINKINIPSILLERWNSKEIYYSRKKIEDNDHEVIQTNLCEKFLRTFIRLTHHYSNISIKKYPYEQDSFMQLQIDEYGICNNELLEETYSLTNTKKLSR